MFEYAKMLDDGRIQIKFNELNEIVIIHIQDEFSNDNDIIIDVEYKDNCSCENVKKLVTSFIKEAFDYIQYEMINDEINKVSV